VVREIEEGFLTYVTRRARKRREEKGRVTAIRNDGGALGDCSEEGGMVGMLPRSLHCASAERRRCSGPFEAQGRRDDSDGCVARATYLHASWVDGGMTRGTKSTARNVSRIGSGRESPRGGAGLGTSKMIKD
jgi:hypothetical protein